ncbi:hypothetical protein NEOLEDRAFT_1180699 [Neolentinus lepideus HHB14362 ss-1]|uniref:Uncharacterized protein n=1 Tax=Neolentinus lepideus HHB14362 ss-1 TaxID=1314782 RepID=A0A165QM48_9AGAM|nr:hypothetical protein NEOLEDRAFT_1180699 [Neolentinus lepideus HHB14362 ss-1]
MRYEVLHGSGIEKSQILTACKEDKTEIKVIVQPSKTAPSDALTFTLRISSEGQCGMVASTRDAAIAIAKSPSPDGDARSPKTPSTEMISRWIAEVDVLPSQSPLAPGQPPPYPSSPPKEIAEAASEAVSRTEPDTYVWNEVQDLLNELWIKGTMPWPFKEPTNKKSSHLPSASK